MDKIPASKWIDKNSAELDRLEAYYWNDVYSEDLEEDEIMPLLEDTNASVYKGILDMEPCTIKDCVDYAIKYDNHAAFVKYYFHRADINRKQIFIDKINKYKEHTSFPKKGRPIIAKSVSGYWRYYRNKTEEYISQDDCIREIVLQIHKEEVAAGTRTAWNKPDMQFPQRDEIIQLGLWLGINVKQVNELLALAACQRLYAADMVDCICMFYLNYYSSVENAEDGIERVAKVKYVIDSKLKEESVSMKLASEKNKYMAYHKDTLLNYNSESDKWGIQEELEKLRDELKSNELENILNTGVLTNTLYKEFEQCKTEQQLEQFIDKNMAAFNNKYYGYLLKISRYILSIERYEKNLNLSSIPIAVDPYDDYENMDIDTYINILSGYKRHNFYEDYKKELGLCGKDTENCRGDDAAAINYLIKRCKTENSELDDVDVDEGRVLSVFEKIRSDYNYNKLFNTYPSDWTLKSIKKDHNKAILLLKYLWDANNVLDAEVYKTYLMEGSSQHRGNSAFTQMFYGVNKSAKKLSDFSQLLKERQEANNKSSQVYEMYMGTKKNLIKLLIATGREDDVVDFLNVAGYWNVSNYDSYDSDAFFDDEYVEDQYDALIRYALAYKEALVEQWIKDKDIDVKQEKKKYIDNFPFLRLIMTISRDIQLVAKYCYDDMYLGDSNHQGNEYQEHIDKLMIKVDDMIYPITESTRYWFEL